MARRGYRVAEAEERAWPVFGIYYQRVVYERTEDRGGRERQDA